MNLYIVSVNDYDCSIYKKTEQSNDWQHAYELPFATYIDCESISIDNNKLVAIIEGVDDICDYRDNSLLEHFHDFEENNTFILNFDKNTKIKCFTTGD